MIKEKTFIVTVLVLTAIIIAQAIVLLKPIFFMRQEVTDPETAVIIAKAALVQKYRDESLFQKELFAIMSSEKPGYWHVSEGNMLGYPPHVLVRRADGKVILRWEQ